ncbi:Hypothetical protein A7982_03912 [Minicystis rosea]|nr:Hypothetical protein A7982_03912 [Minicystis rosea]
MAMCPPISTTRPISPARPARRASYSVKLTAIVVSALVVWHLLGVYLPSLNTRHTSLEGVPHRPSAISPSPPLTRRLAVVVVDGLSFEAARALEEIAPLRREGTFRSLRVEFPSFTSPAITSFVTGLHPVDSGVRLNAGVLRVDGLDSVLGAARDASIPIVIRTRGWRPFAELLMPPPGASVEHDELGAAPDAPSPAERATIPDQRALEFLYIGEVDDAGHEHGGRSAEYQRAARKAGALIASRMRSLDPERDSLVVLSDHGHLASGGHGGTEPEVMHAFMLGVGAAFRRGIQLEERPMHDVAATLSVIAGVRAPSSSLGLPMLDALALDAPRAARVLAAPFDQVAHFSCALLPLDRCNQVDALVARLRTADPAALPLAAELHAALAEARAADLVARRTADGVLHVATLVVALAIAALAVRRFGVRLGPLAAPRALRLPLLNLAVFAGYLLVLGCRPTFSLMPPAPTFILQSIPGVLLAVAAVRALAWWSPPLRHEPWALLAATVVPFALLAAWVGWDPTTVPPPVAGVALFLVGPAVISASIGATLVAGVGPRRVDCSGLAVPWRGGQDLSIVQVDGGARLSPPSYTQSPAIDGSSSAG